MLWYQKMWQVSDLNLVQAGNTPNCWLGKGTLHMPVEVTLR